MDRTSAPFLNKTILLVESHHAVRATVHQGLEQAGLRVIPAFDENDALRALHPLKKAPDVAVIDIRMPEATGLKLAWDLRRRWSTLKIIFTSSTLTSIHRLGAQDGVAILAKPFALHELLESIDNVLEGDPLRVGSDAPVPLRDPSSM